MPRPAPGCDIFSGKHTYVCGLTQNGKTEFVINRLRQTKKPVLFFNPQHIKTPFMVADGRHSFGQIVRALKAGEKIDYRPSLDDETTAAELRHIINRLFESGFTKQRNVILAVDECHISTRIHPAKAALIKAATRGLTFGIHCVFITQRPAEVPYTLFVQADQKCIFRLGTDGEYFTRKKIDYTQISKMIETGGEFSYVIHDGYAIHGPYKEELRKK